MAIEFDKLAPLAPQIEGRMKHTHHGTTVPTILKELALRIDNLQSDLRVAEEPRPLRAALADRAYPILQYFTYNHLPPALQAIARPFTQLAYSMVNVHPSGHPETAAGLRKLMEAKDCAVRASLALACDGEKDASDI